MLTIRVTGVNAGQEHLAATWANKRTQGMILLKQIPLQKHES